MNISSIDLNMENLKSAVRRKQLHLVTEILQNDNVKETLQNTELWKGEHSSPLHQAAARGFVDILKELLAAGANPNCWECSNWNSLTPLQMAVCSNQPEAVRILIQWGVDQNAHGYWGQIIHEFIVKNSLFT